MIEPELFISLHGVGSTEYKGGIIARSTSDELRGRHGLGSWEFEHGSTGSTVFSTTGGVGVTEVVAGVFLPVSVETSATLGSSAAAL
mmetsp:Transcript_20831/g.26504  ORF Transcript_20831/g.26504 Transcript_20831/m.26504 type:complete len:87 (-) Transcript_20831:346-606(-)